MSRPIRSLLCVAILLAVPTFALNQRNKGTSGPTRSSSAPTLASISPTSTTAGTAGLTLTAMGTNFASGAVVLWNGASMTTTFLSATQVSATIPSALLVAAGTAQISVYIPGRWGGTSSALTFTIGPAAAPAITTTTTPLSLATSLPNGTVSTAYTAPMASGGTAPYTLTLTSGALPAGLSFSPSNGQLAGTPTTAASHSFGAQVSDSASNTASYTYSMSIAASTSTTTTSTTPLTLATSLANGTVNTAYAAPVASGGATPYALTITSGGLPAGLSFDASTGALAGTPTNAASYAFAAQVRDSATNTASYTYSMTIAAPTTTSTTSTSATVFASNFDSGSLSLPYSSTQFSNTDPAITMNSNSTYVTSPQYSAAVHYYFTCAVTPCTQDSGLNIWYGGSSPIGGPANGLTKWDLRFNLYLQHPAPGAIVNGIQRKLLYAWQTPSGTPTGWSFFLKGEVNGVNNVPLVYNVQDSPIPGGATVAYYPYVNGTQATLNFDTWNSIEIQVQNDTSTGVTWNGSGWSGSCNGVLKLWVNGTYYPTVNSQLVDVSNSMCLNLGTAYGLQYWVLGEQAQTSSSAVGNLVDEYRYFDDLSLTNLGP